MLYRLGRRKARLDVRLRARGGYDRTVLRAGILAVALCALGLAACGGGSEPEAVRPVGPEALLARPPYLGVSCPRPNRFECDRVGLAVWLREPALAVRASVAGRAFTLDDRSATGVARAERRRYFAGFLQPAGLVNGPLRLRADDGPGRWIGRRPVTAQVELRIVRAPGAAVSTRLDVPLRAGWG